MDAETLRMIERILVVLGGILAICLGYRLFRTAHLDRNSSGKLKTELFEFGVSRVGPGIFFAFFGAYILVSSMSNPIRTSDGDRDQADANLQTIDAQRTMLKALILKIPSKEDQEKADESLETLNNLLEGKCTFQGG
jgi:hypothetical protein